MKAHFFDKAGNFLHTEEMEKSRLRFRLAVPVPVPVPVSEPALPPETLTMKYRVFGGIPVHRGNGDGSGPLFYLYLEDHR